MTTCAAARLALLAATTEQHGGRQIKHQCIPDDSIIAATQTRPASRLASPLRVRVPSKVLVRHGNNLRHLDCQ